MLKLNNTGSIVWVQNYTSYIHITALDIDTFYLGDQQIIDTLTVLVPVPTNDVGISMKLDGFGNIFICGASKGLDSNYHFSIIKINSNSGTMIDTNRIVLGKKSEIPFLMILDNGNIYITGITDSANNIDIQTIKLDNLLNLQWVRSFDGQGLNDIPTCITSDNSGNIFVSGFSKTVNGGSEIVTTKYNSNGDSVWRDYIQPYNDSTIAIPYKLFYSNTALYMSGQVFNGHNQDFAIAKYDQNGNLKILKLFNGDGDNNDIATDLHVDATNNMYVTGIAFDTNLQRKYTLIKYSQSIKENQIEYDSLGKPIYATNELIINFNKSLINSSELNINDLERNYYNIENLLSSSIIDSLNSKVNYDFDFRNCIVYRMFDQKTTDTLEISLSGDTINVSAYWNTFLIKIVQIPSVRSTDKIGIWSDSLNKLKSIVNYANPNIVFQLGGVSKPKDYLYRYQYSLHQTDEAWILPMKSSYPYSINIEPAWEIIDNNEISNNNSEAVKIGIFEEAYKNHPDLVDIDGSSIIKEGKDFTSLPASIITDFRPKFYHGTAVAGIIGAARNNPNAPNSTIADGVAGIAGANFDPNHRKHSCKMYILKIDATNGLTFASNMAHALESARKDFVLNIIDCSWQCSIDNGKFSMSSFKSLEEQMALLYRSDIIMVAIRGNYYGTEYAIATGGENSNYKILPGCYYNNWVINVGASGWDGHSKNQSNGDTKIYGEGTYPCNSNWVSMYNFMVDVLAPGTTDLVATTQDPKYPHVDDYGCSDENPDGFKIYFSLPFYRPGTDNYYKTFTGTCAAAAHVAGIVSLMYARHNPNNPAVNNLKYSDYLGPDDIDTILKMSSYRHDSWWGGLR